MNTWVYICFVVILLGQFWLFFRDRRMLFAKVGSSIVLLGLITLLSASFASWLGWPAGKPTPGVKYAVLAVDIREPQPNRAGHIYVWLSTNVAQNSLNPFERLGEPGSPRAFEIAFTAPSEKAMQRAAQAVRQGQSVSAIFGEDDDSPEGDNGGAGGDPGRGPGNSQHLSGRDGSAPKLFVDEPDSLPLAKK
jgi:hypothetical protein